MAEVFTTRGISFHLEEMIKEAKISITIITPYLKIAKSLYDRLGMADARGVEITIVYGKTKLLKSQEQRLIKLNNCRVIFLENLHAKVFINEYRGIIGSMNLYEYSEINNFELGIHFTRKNDLDLWDSALYEADLIADSGVVEKESKFMKQIIEEKKIINSIIKGDNKFRLENYPIANIDVTKKYGFVTYNLMAGNLDFKSTKNKNMKHFEKELGKEYRLYWESPFKRICIYAKQSMRMNIEGKEEYQREAISKANDIIKKYLV